MMMDTSRRLILIGERRIYLHITATMTPYKWSIDHAESTFDAERLLQKKNYHTGLIILESHSSSHHQDIEILINTGKTLWIALVDKKSLLTKDIRRLIGQLFHTYITFPLDEEKANNLLENAAEMARIMPNDETAKPVTIHKENDYCMVGESATIRRLYRDIGKIASVDAPVLITGESGTGKELTARAIHDNSPRNKGPFNAVNCGALPSGLIQSELFGHEKGAFTGATHRKEGIIESTCKGTLFLDEIGDLPLDMQVNLLRFLENHRVLRVGGLTEIPVDVRVLAATHVNLEKAVQEGNFRDDLYHRINVLQINTPPLRERPEDIEPLATFFFRKFTAEKATKVRGFSRESLVLMRQYAWPGNIRELINRVRRAMVMCDKRLITPDDLGLERRQYASRHRLTLEQARDMAECDAIKAALARNKSKVIHAARELGVSRVTLYRLIDKHGIDRCCGTAADEADLCSANIIRLPSS